MTRTVLFALILAPLAQSLAQETLADSTKVRFAILDTLSIPVKLDIKTGLGDKEKSKLAKAGLIAYLKQSDWAEVVNFGETYAVWIENFQRKLRGNSILFHFDLELRTRADIGSGKLLLTHHVADTVDMSETTDLKTFQDRELYRLIEKKINSRFSIKKLIPTVVGGAAKVGIPGAGGLVQGGLGHFGAAMGRECTSDEAVEGMVLGATLVTHTKAMLNEVLMKKGK